MSSRQVPNLEEILENSLLAIFYFDDEYDEEDELDEDPDAYLLEGGEYDLEDRPEVDDDLPEFDDLCL